MNFSLLMPSSLRPELALFATALERSLLARGNVTAAVAEDEHPDQFFVETAPRELLALSLDLPEAAIAVKRRGAVAGSIPFVLPGLSIRRVRSRVPIVLVSGGDGSGRRIRMTVKALAEAKKRGMRLRAAIFGVAAGEVMRHLDEQFDGLTAEELLRLVASSTCVLECGDESEAPTALAIVATAAGTPVIVHATSALARKRPECVVAIGGWSADDFADAIAAPPRVVQAATGDPAAELLRIVEGR